MEINEIIKNLKEKIIDEKEGIFLYSDTDESEINLIGTKTGLLNFIISILNLIDQLEKSKNKSIDDLIPELHDIVNQPFISALSIYKNKSDLYKYLLKILNSDKESLKALKYDPQFDIYRIDKKNTTSN